MTRNKGKKKKTLEPTVIVGIIIAAIGAFATIFAAWLSSRTQIRLKEIELTQDTQSVVQITQATPLQTTLAATETSVSITSTAYLTSTTPTVAIESTICTKDNSLGWEFEFEDDTEGWRNGRRLFDTMAYEGNLVATFVDRDPYWINNDIQNIDASLFSVIEIRYRINAYDDTAQFMWTTTKTPENQWLEFDIIADNNWHIAIIKLPIDTNWIDRITSLRFDPAKYATSGKVEVDYIRLCDPY